MTIAEQMAADAAAAPPPALTIAQQMAADAAPAPSVKAGATAANAGRWNNDVDANAALGGLIVHGATGLAGSVVGGLRGLATMAFPETMGANPGEGRMAAAARISQEAQQQLTFDPDAQRDPDAVHLIQAAGSKYSPLTIPARVGGAVGNGIANAPNGLFTWAPGVDQSNAANVKGALAAGADAGIQVFGPAAAFKYGPRAIGAVKSATGTLADLTRISPEEASVNAAAIKQRAMAAVSQSSPQPIAAPAPQAAMAQQASQTSTAMPATSPAPMPTPRAAAPEAVQPPTIADASPELQQRVVQMANAGQPINPAVVQRHVQAETLPVPVQLTEGQATLDPVTISNEMNSRGKGAPPVPPQFYNQQAKALGQNLDAIRQSVAPDVAADNPTDHGQVLIDQYKAMDAPVVADINAKYQALRDANGGEFPVDAPQLLANTKAALKSELLTGDAPPSQMSALEGLAEDGKMSFEQFLNLRRNLGNIARTSADGNQRAAAGVMVDQLEQLPLQGGAADMQPLADAARSAARARFQAMDADPAYKAAVNDGVKPGEQSPLADSFVQKYLVGAPRANVANMRANLADQPLAQQTIPAATIDFLRSKAKADVETGQFNAAAYNGVVDKLSPKFDQLLDPQSAQQVQQVGDVAKYTTTQPKGSFVNNSNSTVSAVGQLGLDFAKQALAVKTLGASKVLGGLVDNARAGSSAKASIAPGAGIGTTLSNLTKSND